MERADDDEKAREEISAREPNDLKAFDPTLREQKRATTSPLTSFIIYTRFLEQLLRGYRIMPRDVTIADC